jgi:hypothetical protein
MAEHPTSISGARPLDPKPRRSQGRMRLARTLMIAFGALLPFLLFECSLRLFGPWPPGAYDTGAYIERDARLGHVHVRGYRGWRKTAEYATFIQINSLGLRDRHTAYEKPPSTFRILMLGDSYLEGVQVEQPQLVSERLEAMLNTTSATPIEVVNAGVAAYGTAQELMFFEGDGRRYQPDLVVLLFYVGNDVKNNSYQIEIPGGNKALALKPYFELDRDGSLRLLPGPPPRHDPWVITAMRRCCWSYDILEGTIFARWGPPFAHEDLEVVGGARTPLQENYATRPEGSWRQAWRLTEALLARLRDDAHAEGAPLLLVGVPDWRALDDEVWRQTVLGARGTHVGLSADAPNTQLREIATRLGIIYLDMLPPLRRQTRDGEGPFYFAHDGHWTAAGHAFAAQMIAEMLHEHGIASR